MSAQQIREVAPLSRPRVDERLLWDSIFGNIGYSALLVAHDLGLFPLLAERPRALADICAALGIAPRPAQALLATIVSLGFASARDDRYQLTPIAEDYLLPESPTFFGGFLDLLIANDAVFSFESLKRAVLTNTAQVYGGKELFLSHEQQVTLARAFTRGMHGHGIAAALAWPGALDLGGYRHLLDVGGGSGACAVGAAARWPHLAATVLDLPPVCDAAAEFIAHYGLTARIATRPGDMWRDPFPPADLHFYADIFHDWPPDRCRFLARKSFDSLPPGGRIVIHEMLYDGARTGPLPAAAYSVAMLLWTEGQQHSGDELVAMLTGAGFVEPEVRPTFGYWSIVTARKP